MAKTSRSRSAPGPRAGGGVTPFLLGVLFACAAGAGVWLYLHPHRNPLSPADFPPRLRSIPSPSKPDAAGPPVTPAPAAPHRIPEPPFGISEDVFEAGAHVYAGRCASCHGVPGARVSGRSSQAPAPQFWAVHTALRPGEIFLKTKYGLGSPPQAHAFGRTCSDTQIWQVSLLLANADQGLPDPVLRIMDRPALASVPLR